MIDGNTNWFVMLLNINRINAPIKKQEIVRWNKKKVQWNAISKGTSQIEEGKKIKKDTPCNER